MSSLPARTAYRHVLKASRELFRGDELALMNSRAAIREQFVANKDLPAGSPALEAALRDAQEAADMLRNNFVQARATEQATPWSSSP